MEEEDVDLWTWTWRNCSPRSGSVRKAGGWSLLTEGFLDTEGEAGSLMTLSTRVPDTGSGSSSSSSLSESARWRPLFPLIPLVFTPPLAPLSGTLGSSISRMVRLTDRGPGQTQHSRHVRKLTDFITGAGPADQDIRISGYSHHIRLRIKKSLL